MLEMLLDPKRGEKRPWELFLVGIIYAGLSLVLANWLFSGNPVFAKHISILTITFTVMFSIPFFYFVIKGEEKKSYSDDWKKNSLFRKHSAIISALLWLFLGFVVGYSLGYMLFPGLVGEAFQAQIEQYCSINMPSQISECVTRYGDVITGNFALSVSGQVSAKEYASNIFMNNLSVMIFSVIFSLIFGAGAIFILAWNASVIAAAVGIFAQSSVSNLPVALARYMIHGLPEIGSYFVAALAGGIVSLALVRNDIRSEKFWDALNDAFYLILFAVGLLVLGTIIEVFVTPALF